MVSNMKHRTRFLNLRYNLVLCPFYVRFRKRCLERIKPKHQPPLQSVTERLLVFCLLLLSTALVYTSKRACAALTRLLFARSNFTRTQRTYQSSETRSFCNCDRRSAGRQARCEINGDRDFAEARRPSPFDREINGRQGDFGEETRLRIGQKSLATGTFAKSWATGGLCRGLLSIPKKESN